MSAPDHELRVEGRSEPLQVPDNANLREALLRAGLSLYAGIARVRNCQGRARCGTCAIRVLAGREQLSTRSPPERARLPDAAPDIRLACQAHVRGPITIALHPD